MVASGCAEGLRCLWASCWPAAGLPKRRSGVSDVVLQRLEESQLSSEALSPTLSGRKRIDIKSLLVCADPGRAVGKSYKHLEPLGSGAFGSVFRATCVHTGEVRAIKQIPLTDVQGDLTSSEQ
ncbi:unnamed protein product, partial [Polarella glacialis]